MIKKTCGMIFGEWSTILFSFMATILSILVPLGCDYVRLHFAAINDSNIYFKDPSWFGIGLLYHQNFDENKSSSEWIHNATCYSYDALSLEMFRSSSLESALRPAIGGAALSILVFVIVVLATCIKRGCFVLRLCNMFFSFLSAMFQLSAFLMAFGDSPGKVCDVDHYRNWYDTYSNFEYPDVRYMKFFKECTTGSTGQIALASISLQFITLLWMIMNIFAKKIALANEIEDANNMKPIKSVDKPGLDVIPIESITTGNPQQVEFLDDQNAIESEILVPSPPLKKEKDIEAGPVPFVGSEETEPAVEEVDESVGSPNEETIPLTTPAAKEEEIVAEKVEDTMEELDDLPPLVQKKSVDFQDEVGLDEEGEESQNQNVAEDAVSLKTTDVRKEGEATVGTVKIASMQSGRF